MTTSTLAEPTTRWVVDPLYSGITVELGGGGRDLDLVISSGYLDMTGDDPRNSRLTGVLRSVSPIGHRHLQGDAGPDAEAPATDRDYEVSLTTTRIDVPHTTHWAKCSVVSEDLDLTFILIIQLPLVDLRRGILSLSAVGVIDSAVLGLSSPTETGALAPQPSPARFAVELHAWTK
jgi:hypothetical protein